MFEQQKFNLLREENEGYAKLIVELNQPNISLDNIENVSKNVEALIGYFSLDPNRVLDIILDSFMNFLWNQQPYLVLLRDYKGSNVAQVLGFKFHSHYDKLQAALQAAMPKPVGKEPANAAGLACASREALEDLESKIPKSLLLLTAILISNSIISLEEVWPHLGSTTTQFEEAGELDEVENLINRQIKLAQAQYNGVVGSAVLNKEAHEKKLLAEQTQIKKDRQVMYYNFRLWLLESFVRINQWDKVEEIFGRLYQWKLDLTLHRPTLVAMHEALHWLIEPLYLNYMKT